MGQYTVCIEKISDEYIEVGRWKTDKVYDKACRYEYKITPTNVPCSNDGRTSEPLKEVSYSYVCSIIKKRFLIFKIKENHYLK